MLALALAVGLAAPAAAQTADPPAPSIPQELTPPEVDALLSRLTDAEIRALLRDELVRRAEAQAAAAPPTMDGWAAIEMRLGQMGATIGERVARWAVAIANLDERAP